MKIGIRPSWAVAGLIFRSIKIFIQQWKLSKTFVIKLYLSKNLWAKHDRSRNGMQKSKISLKMQSAVSQQPGAGHSRGQNVEKF